MIFISILSILLLSGFKDTTERNTVDESDKKQLVWLVPINDVDQEIYTAFNNMLVEKGADYTVEFIGFDPMDIEGHQKKLLNMKEKGKQMDLFMTGFGDGEIETDIESVKNELLEPLDHYLQTEQGRKLYDQFDEKVWERSKINQTIYGLNNNSELYYSTAIYINEEVAKDIGFEIPKEIHQLAQLEELLTQSDIDSHKGIIPFAYGDVDLRGLTGYDFFKNGIAVNYNVDGVPYAFNPFEDTEVTTLLKTFDRLAKANYWRNGEAAIDKVSNGQFLIYASTFDPLTYIDGILYHFDKPIKATSYQLSDSFIVPTMNGLTGIASWSENKEEAFDLLTRINTDSDLSNLLYYGIEENHYTLEKGAINDSKDSAQVPGYFSPANRLLVHPKKHEPRDKEKVVREWLATGEKSPIMGFELDSTKIEEELTKIQTIFDNHYDLWLVDGGDVDEQLKQVNEQLAEAGIDLVLEEMNSQLLKWWEAQ